MKKRVVGQFKVQIRFFGSLRDFFPPSKKNKSFDRWLKDHASVKDTVESSGVPHTEVGSILVNGKSVNFSHQVRHRDKIFVYPSDCLSKGKNVKHLQPKKLLRPAFVLDAHLGKLARSLRLLGFNTLYRKDFSDCDIIDIVRRQTRVVLTRDVGLLKNRDITRGYWVRNTDIHKQREEVAKKFCPSLRWRPFSLCLECNGKIKRIAKRKVRDRLPAKTREYYREFYLCRQCGKIYWKGSHFKKLKKIVLRLKRKFT